MKSTSWRGYQIIVWVGQALLTIFAIATAVQRNWQNTSALALFLVASFIAIWALREWTHT